MRNKDVQMVRRSRLAVTIGLAMTVAAAACNSGPSTATSPSGVSPSSLAATGQSTRNFSVTVTPTSVQVGPATLHVTVTREATSGQGMQLGSVEIYVPGGFTIQSVSNISNPNWTSGVSGQTVRVGAVRGNQKLDDSAGRASVTFDINVTSTQCAKYAFTTAQASNSPYSTDPFDPNWTYTGSALSVTVTGCSVPQDCDAAPAVANDYLDSIKFKGSRGDINSSVAQHMTEGARFDGIDACTVEPYRSAVIAFVKALLAV